MNKTHSFHIPVMGIGFTIDTPLKVAQYGMDSVISLIDDILLEKLRKMYSNKFEIPYKEITNKIDDFRAKRITSYLNLIHDLTEKKFEALKNVTAEKSNEIKEYISMLPDSSTIKEEFKKLTLNGLNFSEIKSWAMKNLTMGSIDVNIMTKVDKDNYKNGEKLSVEYNDAHAALRGFANSNLKSSVVLSAGMNPRLYAYMSQFDDFFPSKNGEIKKKIILKVSDYRSALIQGKFLAKKGLWVSEYRIESGLNCGGHAFATDGYLLGPVLEEFKEKRSELKDTIQDLLNQVLINQSRVVPEKPLSLEITAQGGVGTEEEHDFLLDYYKVDSVGWGSPFLLVPEATTVDKETLNKLALAKEEDLYLSDISPLGIPFNNLRGNTKDLEKESKINIGRPGSVCPKRFVALNKEFKEKGICTASREYQRNKINELSKKGLSPSQYLNQVNKVTEKTCTCVGLGTSALLAYDLDTKVEGQGVSVCPGPNMAYYSKVMSLKDITNHIYGRLNIISRTDRPNMFIKELNIYIDFLQNKLEETKGALDKKQEKYFSTFSANLNEGISYYHKLFGTIKDTFEEAKSTILNELEVSKNTLQLITLEIECIKKI
ncbi:MAG: hypothetical protein DRI75_08785 [Bacteroidetes bacterium]|nr:MAG: hypothetical protein DRI75_08785 [Bacteroidota bacterium]